MVSSKRPKSSTTKTHRGQIKRIALFNHKGGVSSTTTTFNLGWMLATKGHRVVLVDADPQCNLSRFLLRYKGPKEYEVSLGMAQQLSGTIQTVENLPGSLSYLIEKTAKEYDAEYVLIDMSPS